jgi:MFS family permease
MSAVKSSSSIWIQPIVETVTADSPRGVLVRFAPMIYGPTLLFAVGEGAVIPLIPVIANRLGADVALAALVAAALVVGQLCGNIPAGWAVARFGERITMGVAGIVILGGLVGVVFAGTLAIFAAAVFLIGFCAASFSLARHSFMTTRVPLHFRARALSLLGGTFRLGMFVGPFISAALLGIFGDEKASILFFAVCQVATILLVFLGPDPEKAVPAGGVADSPHGGSRDAEDTGEPVSGAIPTAERVGVFRTMWRFRAVLARLGLAAASLSAVRSARQVVLPLWGVSLGLDASTIAVVVGVSGAIDFALFYASGQVMDRFGRLWAALPAMILMGAGFLALAFTHDLSSAAMWFATFAAVLGVGNGLSSGILLTLGADLAPPEEPAAFLGSWRTLTDAGGAVAPVLISTLTATVSLSGAVGAMGVIAALGAFGFVRWVPRYVPRAR